MNKGLYFTLLFFFLLFLQVLVLNNILFLGYINPYIYIAFVFFYPLNEKRFLFLFLCFLLGLSVDFFTDSGGINAFATLFIGYFRLFFVRVFFRKTPADYSFFKPQSESFGKFFNYVVTLTVIHHFLLFSFANFSFQNSTQVLLNTLFSSIFTLILFFLGTYIFTKN